jgi:translation initiation factor 1
MAKPAPKSLLLVAAQPHALADAAAVAFQAAFRRFGLNWTVTRSDLAGPADRLLTFDGGPDDHLNVRLASEVEPAVNQWLATMLGGGQPAPVVPPPPPPPKKVLTAKLSRETAGRRGKGVTVISDLNMSEANLTALATWLKTACGTGGTAKDGRIEIQGDMRDRIAAELEKLGYKVKRAGG